MTHRSPPDRQSLDDELGSWLRLEAPAAAPESILVRARSEFATMSQDPASVRRQTAISSVVAVVAAAALTMAIVQLSPRTDAPGGTPAPGARASVHPSQREAGMPTGLVSASPSPSIGASASAGAAPDAGLDGNHTFAALDAGSVTIVVAGGEVSLVEVDPRTGWSVTPDDAEPDEVEFDLSRGTQTIEFAAEVEDRGVLEVSIEERSELLDGTRLVELPDGAGTIALRISGGQIATEPLTPASGWRVDDERRDPRDGDLLITISSEDGFARIAFEAEVEDGRFLDLEITLHRSGPSVPG